MTNAGNAALSITSIAFAGANATDFTQVDTCGASVAAGGNCTIAILFTPSATGTRVASLGITDNASGSPQPVLLSGTGTQPTPTGTTYYVDNCVVIGSDANNGTSTATPWLTIHKVNASTFNPGDSILLESTCIWREQLTVPSSGSAASPITFGAYGTGAQPIISGADLLTSWVSELPLYYASAVVQPNQVFRDDQLLTLAASKAALATGLWWWDSTNSRVYVYDNPSGGDIEASDRNEGFDISQNYVTVSGIHATKSNSTTMGGFVLNGNDITVSGNLSDYNVSAGIRVWNNTTEDILITNNETAYNGQGIYSWQQSAALGHEVIVQYNNIHDNTSVGGVGDHLMINANYWIVQYNWLHNNGDTVGDNIGIHIYSTDSGSGWGQHNIVRYNLISGEKSPLEDGSGIELDKYTSNNQIYGNVITGCSGPGIDIYDSTNVSIYGNSLYGNWQNPASNTPPTELSLAGPIGLTTGAVVENNVAYSTGSSEYAIYMDSQTVSHAPLFTTNLWYAPNSSNWYYNGSAGNSLPTWNALSYVGTDNYANPLFTNAPSDLSLQSGSPAIDAGADLGSTYRMGLAPGSAWPSSVSLLNQNSYGTGWEVGAYVYP